MTDSLEPKREGIVQFGDRPVFLLTGNEMPPILQEEGLKEVVWKTIDPEASPEKRQA